jgi:molecular chaperone GrpE (heat shock protein)
VCAQLQTGTWAIGRIAEIFEFVIIFREGTMSQDKDEYEVGIPLDDLVADEKMPEDESGILGENEVSSDEPVMESDGLPSLFDEDELAEIGLKASPFDDDDEMGEPDDELPLAPDNGDEEDKPDALPELVDVPAELSSAIDEPDTLDGVPDDQETPEENLASDELPEMGTTDAPSEPQSFDLKHNLADIQSQLAQLKAEFAGKIKYDEHKDEIIDKLHQELQEYKQDIVKKHILSIVLDVVKVADDIRKWIAYFRSLDVSQRDPVKLFRYLEAIPSDLEDIFYWQGVKPYTNREGIFDPAKQRTIKKITTDDPSKDKTIAKSLRPGYEWEGKVIRQEMVAVYVYEDMQESVNTGNIDE